MHLSRASNGDEKPALERKEGTTHGGQRKSCAMVSEARKSKVTLGNPGEESREGGRRGGTGQSPKTLSEMLWTLVLSWEQPAALKEFYEAMTGPNCPHSMEDG